MQMERDLAGSDVILSASEGSQDARQLRILRSFAVFAAQDDVASYCAGTYVGS